jgi:hypothetical protein
MLCNPAGDYPAYAISAVGGGRNVLSVQPRGRQNSNLWGTRSWMIGSFELARGVLACYENADTAL